MENRPWNEKDKCLLRQIQEGNCILLDVDEIDEKEHEAIWNFGQKVCCQLYPYDPITGKKARYAVCKWQRLKCKICLTLKSCSNSGNFVRHLQDRHSQYFKDPDTPIAEKIIFANYSRIPLQQLLEMDSLDEKMSRMFQLAQNFFTSISKFTKTKEEDESTSELPSAFLAQLKKFPKTANDLPDSVVQCMKNAIISHGVGLNVAPNAMNNGCLAGLIDVCLYAVSHNFYQQYYISYNTV